MIKRIANRMELYSEYKTQKILIALGVIAFLTVVIVFFMRRRDDTDYIE